MAYKCNEALAVDDGHHGRCVKRGATTMGNMFDNLGKGLNDFTKQAGKIAEISVTQREKSRKMLPRGR